MIARVLTEYNKKCFLFTVGFESLYTNMPVEDAIEKMKNNVFNNKT